MKNEKIAMKLRGIKAMLQCISEIKGHITDSEFAMLLMAEELENCIKELEEN